MISTTVHISYVLRARDILDFNEPESLRICIVPSVARAIRGCLEGSLKSSMSRVYGVHNMFSAERARASNPRASVTMMTHRTRGHDFSFTKWS